MTERIYRIPAREVVPGMLLSTRDGKFRDLVTDTMRAVDGISMWGDGWFRCCPPDRTSSVSLPGPSPRELLCTCCFEVGCGHMVQASLDGWFCEECRIGMGWSLEANECNREGQREFLQHVGRAPGEHDPGCPVAPNLDPERGPIHGGLRLWPVGGTWIAGTWGVRRRLGVIGGGAAWLNCWRDRSASMRDLVLEVFFRPPTVPDLPTALEQRPTPWDPEDVHEVLG